MASMFAALGQRNYRIFWSGSLVSNVGTWMQRVAQDWLVLELSGGSGVAVGITTALQFAPTLVLPGLSGLAADRFDKRKLLMVTQVWMALCSLVLGLLAVSGTAATWHVYVVALLFGVGSAFDIPARQSFVPEVVGAERLPNAIALNSAAFNSARLIGPGLAGLVINQFGSGWAILTNAFSYLAFIGALLLIKTSLLERSERAPRGKRQIRQSIAYVRNRPDILLVLGVIFFIGTFGMNFQMTSALMTTEVFNRDAADYGILGTIMAIGSLTGALIGARRSQAPRLRFFLMTAFAFGALTVTTGLMPTYLTYALLLPVVGLSSMLTMNAANTIVQMSVDPKLRGRVMALYILVMQGGTPFGAPLLGFFGELWGARWTLIIGGGMVVLGGLVVVLLLRRTLEVELLAELRPYGSRLAHPSTLVRRRSTVADEPSELVTDAPAEVIDAAHDKNGLAPR